MTNITRAFAGACCAVVAALGASACTGAPASAPPESWSTCTNSRDRYTIAYPGSWHAKDCRLFDPKPIEIVEGSDCCPTALMVSQERETFKRVSAWATDPLFVRTLSRAEISVDGHQAIRVETEATGEGLYDEGTLSYLYVIDRDGLALIVETVAAPDADFERQQRVVDQAVESLQLDAAS
jgi:hypothetical protein